MHADLNETKIEQLHSLEDQAVFALTELCRAYIRREGFSFQPMYKEKGDTDGSSWSMSSLAQLFEEIPGESLDVLQSPIRSSLRNSMVIIGETLYKKTGSTALMSKVLERLEDDFGDDGGRVASVLDHAFHGIGGWMA